MSSAKRPKTWTETFNEVFAATDLRRWSTVGNAGSSRSALALTARIVVRFPELMIQAVRNRIVAMKFDGEDLITMSKRRDREGYEKYGNKWERPAKLEAREEFSDAYNYIQWTRDQGDIDEHQEAHLLSRVLELDHLFRVYALGPPLSGAPSAKHRIPKGYCPVRTIKSYEPSERPTDRDDEGHGSSPE